MVCTRSATKVYWQRYLLSESNWSVWIGSEICTECRTHDNILYLSISNLCFNLVTKMIQKWTETSAVLLLFVFTSNLQPKELQIFMGLYTVNNGVIIWDQDELRPVWVRIALHTFLFMRLVIYMGPLTRHELFSYRSETVPFSCKTKTNLRPGP